MRNSILTASAVLLALASALLLSAQTYNIPWHKIAGGGGTFTGGIYSMSSTTGQHDAGQMTGDYFDLEGGFWNAISTGTLVTTPVTKVVASGGITLFLRADGSLWGMGGNYAGQLGDGTSGNFNYRFTPERVVPSGVADMAAGQSHSLFLKTDGSLWAMGDNSDGQFGNGTPTGSTIPVQIQPGNVRGIAAGWGYTLFVKSDGSLWGMGRNSSGQLGDGSLTARFLPVQIVPSGVRAVACGYFHSLFVKTDGSLWAMGDNSDSELGDGSRVNTSTPELVIPGGVMAVAAGQYDSLFLKSDGSLWGMGYNYYGQLGDVAANDPANDIPVPRQIVGEGVATIANGAGGDHTLFIKTDSSLWAMGYNYWGQLGDGTTTDRHVPEQIIVTGVSAIAAASSYSLFVECDGSLWGMGWNQEGELGTDTAGSYNTPVRVVASGAICGVRIVSVLKAGNDLLLSFTSQLGHIYNLLSASDLSTGAWSPLLTDIPGNGAIVQATIPNAFVQPHQFYRIQLVQ
jgi:alpha-tubulin suppressor-like RCC1 family protein